jgi:hypothetical protein
VSWNWTLTIASFGGLTGGYGAIVSTWGRRDITWRRRAKQLPQIRPALEALRNAVAEARQGTITIRGLQDIKLRGHLEELEEHTKRLSDRKLREQVKSATYAYSRVIAKGDDTTDHSKTEAMEFALVSLKEALKRADFIEKKAPA